MVFAICYFHSYSQHQSNEALIMLLNKMCSIEDLIMLLNKMCFDFIF